MIIVFHSILELTQEDLHEHLSQANIDGIYSLIVGLENLPEETQMEFSQLQIQMVSTCLRDYSPQSPNLYKQNMKILFYFFTQLSLKLERIEWKTDDSSKKSKIQENQSMNRKSMRYQSLYLLVNFLQLESSSLWSMSMIPENFLTPIWKYTFYLLESRPNGISGISHQDQETRQLCLTILQLCIEFGNENIQDQFVTAMLNGICQFEHLTNWMAELCAKANTVFIAKLMTEISHMSFNDSAKDSSNEEENKAQTPKLITPAKHIGIFLVNWTELNPAVSCKYLPLVLHQFASDAHQIRYLLAYVLIIKINQFLLLLDQR